MSRIFTKNLSNYMSLGVSGLGTILSGLAVFTLHAKVRIASITTGAADNNIVVAQISGSSLGAGLNIDGTGGVAKARVMARSVTADATQTKTGGTLISLGVDTYVGGIVNIAGDTLEVWVNGVSDGSSAVTFANATWTIGTPTGNDAVGGEVAPPLATTDQFDGELSEIAIWNIALSGANFASLANGTPASSVAAANLVYYLPISGTQSPEPPTVGTPVGTITGSLPQGLLVEQEGFRWRNDDGSETTATWKAAQDMNVTAVADQIARLRLIVNTSSDTPSKQFKLQYRKVGDPSWRDIDTTG